MCCDTRDAMSCEYCYLRRGGMIRWLLVVTSVVGGPRAPEQAPWVRCFSCRRGGARAVLRVCGQCGVWKWAWLDL